MQCGIWKCISEFLFSVTLKSIGLLCTLNGSFSHVWFCNNMDWSLENTGLQNYIDIPKFWHISLYNIKKKITFINITVDLIRKVLVYLKAVKLHNSRTSFLKFWFLLRSSNFITDNKYYQLFSLNWQAPFVHFEKISAKYPVWKGILCHLVFQAKKKKKKVVHEKNG